MTSSGPRAWLATPPGRAGIAIIELAGPATDLDRILLAVAPAVPVGTGEAAVRRLAGIDDGLVARLATGHAQLMPHGGPAIVRRIAATLETHGVSWLDAPPTEPRIEARSSIESLALDRIAESTSPLAVEVLLRQVAAWSRDRGPLDEEELERSRRLDRLVAPATIACVGAPNAGKSSLLNALVERDAAIVSEVAGTTRDRVARRIDLSGVVVEWIDTPGIRASDDPIERAAIEASLDVIAGATLVVHLRSPDTEDAGLPPGIRPVEGVLAVRSKSDLDGRDGDDAGAIHVSVVTGEGLADLAKEIRRRIVRPEDVRFERRWAFDPRLEAGEDPLAND